jgi:phosphatidylinositol alpha-1,6-mannosyltransferase
VLLPGYLDDESVDTLLSDCLFFALPNSEEAAGHVEGFGLVFAEAAAWGKAVLAGDSGGAREAVVDGVTGLLVPPGEPSALEAALLRLIEDSALREQLGKAGRRRVEETLNWNVFTREVLCSMDDALAARKDGSP